MGLAYLTPHGLDLSGVFPSARPLALAYAKMLVSLIVERRCHTVGNKRAKERYVRMNYRPLDDDPDKFSLMRYMPECQLSDAMKMLKAFGVIEDDGSWSSGRFPQGYRLMPPWNEQEIEEREFGDGWAGERVGRRLELARRHHLRPVLPIHHVLIEFLYRLEIDKEAAVKFAYELAESTGKDCLPFYNAVIAMIAFKQPIFKPDKSGRCHTSFSICPREIRKLVRYGDEKLVSVDLSAAQAFFLAQIASRELKWKNFIAITAYKEQERISKSIPMCRTSSYLDLVCHDRWYDVWQSAGGYADRDTAKKAFVAMLNNTETRTYYAKERKTFKELCPTLAKFHGSFWGKTVDGKSLLSRLLQSEEASYVMDVCERLHAAYPDMPLLTIHDCIATTPEYLAFLLDTMRAAAVERWGIAPHTKMANIFV